MMLSRMDQEFLKQVSISSDDLGVAGPPSFDAKYFRFLQEANGEQGQIIQQQDRTIKRLEWSRSTWKLLAVVSTGSCLILVAGILWFVFGR